MNWFPLAEPPFKNKTRIIEDIRKLGVQEPRLYAAGFAHNNCGGFCVKAGVGQMVHLWKTLPERYLEHEQKELPQSGSPVSDFFVDGLKKVASPPSRA